jgi:hypothetical protein
MRLRKFGGTGQEVSKQQRLDPAVDNELNAWVSRRKAERQDRWR